MPDRATRSLVHRRRVQRLLQIGLTLSVEMAALGLVLALAGGQWLATDSRPSTAFTAGPAADPLMGTGLLVLSFTPILRVITSVILS